ncbi:ssDNA endodeoxyribonuclease [Mortierella antarctica]|nr:ssDNA endodeoxyribonuclease [Mortierella antarctica]
MSQAPNECRFSARLRNVKHFATLIKSVNFKDVATCKIEAEGISFIMEDSRCLFARCLIQRTVFEDYRYISPVDSDTPDAPIPHGYDQYGSVSFGINLATLLSCLNMFGTANAGGYNNDSTAISGGGGTSGGGAGSVTPVKLSYNGIGSKFTLILEDNGVVTTCRIPTFDPDPPIDFEFNDERHSKVIMKSGWLEEGLRDLDATSYRVVLRLSPEIPHFRISSLGTIENLDVNYSKGDVIETFVYPYAQPTEISYNFTHMLHVLRACAVASTVNIMVDDNDFLKMQFLIPLPDHKFLFAEYAFCPIEPVD